MFTRAPGVLLWGFLTRASSLIEERYRRLGDSSYPRIIAPDLDIAERREPQDGRFSVKLGGQKIDLRVAAGLPTVYSEKVVLRLLDTSNAQVELTNPRLPR